MLKNYEYKSPDYRPTFQIVPTALGKWDIGICTPVQWTVIATKSTHNEATAFLQGLNLAKKALEAA